MVRITETSLIYTLLILGFCAAKCVSEELTVRLPTGDSLVLGAYSSHEEFLTNLHRTINRKVQTGTETLLRYAKLNIDQPDYFLLNTDSNQYLFLQLVQSLASKDVTFTNLLLKEFQGITIKINPISNEWIRSNIKLPTESMYDVVQSIVYADSMGILEIPKEVIGEILLMANKSELLHRSCEEGDLKLSEWLLGLGKDYDLVPLLENAMNNGRLEIAKLLLRYGALKNIRDVDRIKNLINTTLLHVAVASNVPEVVAVLVDLRAPINAVDEAGRSPLLVALQHNDTASAKVLLSKGADAKLISNSGDTALHIASSKGNVDVITLLLKHSTHFNLKNNLGLTPLNIAEQSGIFYLVEYLLQQNIKIPSPISTHSNVLPYIYTLNDPARWTNKSGQKNIENYCEETRLFNIRSHHVPYEKDLKTKLLELVIKNAIPFLTECLINLGADLSSTNRNEETLLFNAVRSGSSEIVRILINEGIDVGAKDVNGTTALHVAAGNGFQDIVSLLLKRGAEIDAESHDGLTPLHKAAASGHLAVVEFLLDKNVNVSKAQRPLVETPLQLAAYNGHMEVVQNLLDRGVFDDTKSNETWNTLHAAAKAGHTDIVNFLLERGYDVNVADAEGKTPLFWAAFGGSVPTVLTLLGRGADIHSRSNFMRAAYHRSSIIAKSQETPLHVAAFNGHLEVSKILFEKGIDKDTKDALGETPLYNAALRGHYNVVKYLVEKKAFKNEKNTEGSTALHAAAEGGHNEVIDYLYDKGMDIDIEGSQGQTPLHYACKFGHLSTVKNLIGKLANVNAGSDYGTPLSVAVRKGYKDIVTYLLVEGADIEVTDDVGNSLLMEAIINGQKDIVTLLMKRGARLNAKSKRIDGKTPLHLAMDMRHDSSMAMLLLQELASVHTTAKDGTTALFEAVENQQEDVIKEISTWVGVDVNNTRKTDQLSCLHVAVIGGSLNIVKTLLDHGAYVNALDIEKNTPLHFAVNNEEIEIARLLLERGGNVNIKNKKGQTPFHIAKTLDSPLIVKTLRLCDCERR